MHGFMWRKRSLALLGALTLALVGLLALSRSAAWTIQASAMESIVADHGVALASGSSWQGQHWMPPVRAQASAGSPQNPGAAAAADYNFSKTVLSKSLYDETLSCSGSSNLLTVNESVLVVYCYRFENIGTTTFLTITLVDDKLGNFGPLAFSPDSRLSPGASGLFVTYGVPLTRTTTNHAVLTLDDDQGNSVVKQDSATVNVVIPPTTTATPTEAPTLTPTATSTPGAKLWLPVIYLGR